MSTKLALLEETVAPAVQALGYELWGCVLVPQKKHLLLRVYIDKPGGVTIDDCTKASHQINGVLAVENKHFSSRDYTLEVSSPGVERELFKFSQYAHYEGHKIKLRLTLPVEGRRHFQGVIIKVEQDKKSIVIQTDVDPAKAEFSFGFDQIEHAHLVSETNSVRQPKARGEKR